MLGNELELSNDVWIRNTRESGSEKRLVVIVHFLNQKLKQVNRDRKQSRGSGWYIVHPEDEDEPIPVADEHMSF